MKTTIRKAATCLLAAGLALTVTASPASAGGRHAGIQRVLEQAVADGTTPGIIAEVRDGDGRWFGAEGVADTGTGRERHRQDRFRIGSTTKAFTSTVVLKLVAEGRLSLEDSVEKWLPGVVRGNGNDGAAITVRQLLNQTSGLFAYTLDPAWIDAYFSPNYPEHQYEHYRPGDLVAIAMTHPPLYAPGTSWNYSNTNFVLAGMIIEKVTGRSYADEVTRRILRPLGMSATYVPGDETVIRGPHGRAYSTLWQGPTAERHDVTDMDASWGRAAGDMVSTTGDLQTFFRALLGGRLLPPALLEEMLTTIPTDGKGWLEDRGYGLGIVAHKLPCGVTAWGNGGMIHGSWTYAMGSKDGSRMVVSNINGDWGDALAVFTAELEAELCP
ncbi:D-alanyl-D-alanine carboxypeptidase [Actinorhabdospora filicis]|uniref:D-alanyl-D-alanine carboxypeptidase n=1 Tax=Actinorhabdospora filicis TaxID=1785913 RepID=A0A9W6SQ03_9ACTN|nr:serine hydrolase domain-containing protein [Actinorhabdospora filicis]GLZ78626.1 D-alanyl-D-alanine carboxypeptidase [Actinorhabdospora filicis]